MSDIIETPIGDLIVDARCQSRENMNWDAVGDYRAAYEAGESLPPLEAFGVKGKLIIVDGFHRYEAARRAKVATLPVRTVGKGSMALAEWHALSSNQRHGLRRTREDKRRAVRLALEMDDTRSNREIAKHVGVSHTFVANLRSLHERLATLPTEATGTPTLQETADRLEQAALLTREALAELRAALESKTAPADPDMLLGVFEKQEAAAALIRSSMPRLETIKTEHDMPLLLRVHRASEAAVNDLRAHDDLWLRLEGNLKKVDRMFRKRIAELEAAQF